MVIIEELTGTPDRGAARRPREEGNNSNALVVKTFGGSSNRQRMSADPSLSVSDIFGALKNYVESCCNGEGLGLVRALTPPTGCSWKSATPVAWILKIEPLLNGLLEKVPSGVLTSRKSKEAFRRVHEDYPLLKGPKKGLSAADQLADTVDSLDDSLRMVLAHMRDCKLSKTSYERVAKRASQEEMEKIMRLLEKIALSSSDCRIRQNSFGSETATPTPSRTSTTRTSPKKAKAAGAADEVNPGEVFARVLQRKNAFVAEEKSSSSGRKPADGHDEPLLQTMLTSFMASDDEEEGEDSSDCMDAEHHHDDGEEEAEEEEDCRRPSADENDDRALIMEAKAGAPVNSSGYTLRKKLNAARKSSDTRNPKTKKDAAAKAFELKRVREKQKKKAGKKCDDDEAPGRASFTLHQHSHLALYVIIIHGKAAPNQEPPKKKPKKSNKAKKKEEANCVPFALLLPPIIPPPPAPPP